MNKNERNHFLDIIKGIFTICVILLHFNWRYGENNSFVFSFLINFSVPAFVFISGYLFSVSYEKTAVDSFEKAYSFSFLAPKLLRIVIPFTIAFLVEYVLFRVNGLFMVNLFKYGLLSFFFDYIKGGYGPGNYYVPLFIQFILFFPVIYFVIKKFKRKGLAFLFIGNIIYEILKSAYLMNEEEYRFIFFRYLFVASAGCYAALCEKDKNVEKKYRIIDAVELLIGLFFIVLVYYTDYEPKILNYWKGTSFATCMFIVPVLKFLLYISKNKIRFYPLEVVGMASFNIFLVQMIFYCIYFPSIESLIDNYILRIFICTLICVCVGVVFFLIESFLTREIINKFIKTTDSCLTNK